jgi:hypothetical protein
MVCPAGHMTECHYPYSCVDAQCGHYEMEAALDPYMVSQNWEDPEDFGIDDMEEPACEICGCAEDNACEGGCAWSERFLPQSRMICTSCEPLMIMFQISMNALRMLQDERQLLKSPEVRKCPAM